MHALIATDGSEVSLDAARQAHALLKPSKVTLLTVADTSIATDSGAGGFEGNLLSPVEAARARDAILEEGADEVSDTIRALGMDPATVEHKVVEGAAGPMIVHVADTSDDIDVVVVGSHGRGFIKRVVLGSVSEYVVRHCERPVLVVRHEAGGEHGDAA